MQNCEIALTQEESAVGVAIAKAEVVSLAYRHYVACHYWLQQLYLRFTSGRALLPEFMGLAPSSFARLGASLPGDARMDRDQLQRQQVLSELLAPRYQERDDLALWLNGYIATPLPELSAVLATASMGFNHLWEDLGLDSRTQLRLLMQDCFPQLVVLNKGDMRWKKFFYRQLCEQEGAYLCRAPSCDICPERSCCFSTD
jgi:nitrogen fixation protein NifQ